MRNCSKRIPPLRPLFTSDLDEQKRKLMKMIGVAVNALDRLETIVPAVRNLGQRHGTYGVKASRLLDRRRSAARHARAGFGRRLYP